MHQPRFLVFDLDGTLIDSSLDLCNSVNAAMLAVGKSTLPNAVIAGYIGDGAAMLVMPATPPPAMLSFITPSSSFSITTAYTSSTTPVATTACWNRCIRFADVTRAFRWPCRPTSR